MRIVTGREEGTTIFIHTVGKWPCGRTGLGGAGLIKAKKTPSHPEHLEAFCLPVLMKRLQEGNETCRMS